jgi:hypothetical protein
MNYEKKFHYLKIFDIAQVYAFAFKEWAHRSLVHLNVFQSFLIAQTQCPTTKNFNHHILGKVYVRE